MSRYRKIDPGIWNDEKFRSLSDDAKLVFFFLLTHPHMTALGAMRASIPGLAAELNQDLKAFREAFREPFSKDMVKHDEKASFVCLPNFLKYNKPESPNVVKSWVQSADLLPECAMKTQVIHAAKALLETLDEGFLKALPKAFRDALAKTMPNQEQEQEQDINTSPNGSVMNSSQRKKKRPSQINDERFEEAWTDYPPRAGDNSKLGAQKAWNARIREGAEPAEMIAGVKRYKAYVQATGKAGTEFVKQAKTFFGPEKHYLEEWQIPTARLNDQRSGNGSFVG